MRVNSCEQLSTKPHKTLPPPSWWSAGWPSGIQLTLSIWLGHLTAPLTSSNHSQLPLLFLQHTTLVPTPGPLHSLFPPPRLLFPISPKVCFLTPFKPLLVSGLSWSNLKAPWTPFPVYYHSTPSVWHFIHLHVTEHYLNTITYLFIVIKSLWGQRPCLIHCCIPNTHTNPWTIVGDLCAECLVAQSCPTLCNSINHSPPGSSVHGDSPHKNTAVACHALLQEVDYK